MTSYPVNMPFQVQRGEATRFLHIMLGIWLGVYAFRSFVPTAVWNLSDALPLALKGGLAIGVHLLGLAGSILPVTRRRNAVATLAVAAALIGISRQIFIGHDTVGSLFSLAGWIVWLWWLVALARRIEAQEAHIVVAAFATALSLQVGMQAAWHGLDLPMARGMVAVACTVVLHALFAASAAAFTSRADTSSHTGSTRVFIAVGVALFMELTLLANVGRIGAITGLGLVGSALLIQVGLVAGVLLAASARARVTPFAAIVTLLIAALVVGRVHGITGAILVPAQAAAVVLMFASAERPHRSAASSYVIGAVALFILVFLFYNWYELPVLWLAAAIALTLCALPLSRPRPVRRAYIVAPAVGFVLALFGALPGTRVSPANAPYAQARVLTYNIHQGYDAFGMPAMQNIADEIAEQNADVVALQEVGRGWTLVGGADLVAYLKFRFPDYRVHFVPVNGQLWGVALMSRLPIDSLAGSAFESAPHTFRYGYAAGTVRVGAARVRVVSVHLTAGLEGNGADGRLDQIDQLLSAIAAHDNVVIAGDLNTHPNEPPMQRIASAGYADAAVTAGVAHMATWPAHQPNERIDYVLTRGMMRIAGGDIRRTNASDHLPVLIELVTENGNSKP